ncbi:MAG: HipA domain-containing protein, partial [Zoogloeaceae bacterium]|nr:HipA domain-containing protein [Zoogloeaceae bacterium]
TPLAEVDFLLAVNDFSRTGALRFRQEGQAVFLSAEQDVPPLLHLDELTRAVANAESDSPELRALARLRQAGSTLGGARPKCSVIDEEGALAIAKFTSTLDTHAVEKAEVLTLWLARDTGIKTPSARLVMSAGLPVAIISRFDRAGTRRLPFISAQTLLDAPTATGGTYLEVADALRAHSANPQADLAELFRRVAFTILVSNVDDHLKNHGFLHVGQGRWRLSPIFDVNPAPERQRELKTAIADPGEPQASLDLLMAHAFYFEQGADEAIRMIGNMAHTIFGQWRAQAKVLGMTRAEVEDFRPAFEHPEMDWALALKNPRIGATSSGT